MMALMSEPLARLLGCSRLGSLVMMFWRIGRRKAIVLPVPVRAWAILQSEPWSARRGRDDRVFQFLITYTSIPLSVSLMVLLCTSVIVVKPILLVKVSTTVVQTRPRSLSSVNFVIVPEGDDLSSTLCAD